MKRVIPDGDGDRKMGKKPRVGTQVCVGGGDPSDKTGSANLDDNLLFEVFNHVDARTLAMTECLSKQGY